jgi:uncharacterized membrane protein
MVKFVTFLYDTFRFSALIFLLLPEIRANMDGGYVAVNFFCVASLALFPFMTFFMWFDSKKYKIFAYLYIAGKIAGVCAAVSGVFSFHGDFMPELLLLDTKKFFAALVVPIFIFFDLLFLIPVSFQLKKVKQV